MTERRFPLLFGHGREGLKLVARLGCPRSVPWSFVAPHEAQARANHDQTLERLAERGGLSPSELVAVVRGEGYRVVMSRSDEDAIPLLLELLERHACCSRSPS